MDQEAAARRRRVPVRVPAFMKEIVAALTAELRRSPHVNHRSGVSVRYSIGNLETLAGGGGPPRRPGRRARGRAARLRPPRGAALVRGARRVRHDRGRPRARDPGARPAHGRARGLPPPSVGVRLLCRPRGGSTKGSSLETSDLTPASELLGAFGDLPGLAKMLDRLGVEEESPGVAASALEFALEGLHLSRRLNKDGGDGEARYTAPAGS